MTNNTKTFGNNSGGELNKPEIGKTYSGKISVVMPYGAFVEVLPGFEGLLDIKSMNESERDSLKAGQNIEVVLVGMTNKTGNLRLKHSE